MSFLNTKRLWGKLSMKKRKVKQLLASCMALMISVSSPSIIWAGNSVSVVQTSSTSEVTITDSSTIKSVQQMLKCLGYDCGTPDGIAGNGTKNAVIEYQKAKGQPETGNITVSLMVDLYSDVLQVVNYMVGSYDDVLDKLYNNNDSCNSASQQAANGAYRVADMLSIITKSLDSRSEYNSDIVNSQATQILNDTSCSSAPQQEINGLYRTVELLGVWAKENDKGSKYSSDIEDTLDTFSTRDASCTQTPQQAVNGSYRAVELLNIIAKQLDTKNKYGTEISSIILSWCDQDSSCTFAPQQEVNGLYTCVKLLNIIALEKDSFNLNSSRISTVMSTFSTSNSSCDTAPQQIVNGYYRMTELLYIIASLYD